MSKPFFSIIIQSSNVSRYESVYNNLAENVFWHRRAKQDRKLKPKARKRRKSNDKFIKVEFEVIIEEDIDIAVSKSNADYIIISEDNLIYSHMYLSWMYMFFTRITLHFNKVLLISPSNPLDVESPFISKSFMCSKEEYFKVRDDCKNVSISDLQNKFYDIGYTPFFVAAAEVMNG